LSLYIVNFHHVEQRFKRNVYILVRSMFISCANLFLGEAVLQIKWSLHWTNQNYIHLTTLNLE